MILIVNACSSRDVQDNVVGVCFVGQDVTGQKQVLDKFTRIQGDYKAIVQNPNPLIPPIFGTDEYGYCSEWNPSMEKLTGWKREEVSQFLLNHGLNQIIFALLFSVLCDSSTLCHHLLFYQIS